MTIFKSFLLLFLSVSVLSLGNGCAPSLPNVSEKINETPTAQKPLQIASAKGLLSPEKSKNIMDRLKRSVDPTDILERHTAVVESVTESLLIKGNKVTLLIDGPATYAAMFEAILHAEGHINLETFIIDDDEIGRNFTDLLLQKQAEGVQVNINYDSVGSITTTPESFFKRLRDGGIQVVEFNPVNPLKDNGEWMLMHPDHRKILVVDGRVAIIGGINISSVYSGRLSGTKKGTGKSLPWRDTDIRIEGPAVTEVQKLFLETWRKQEGPELAEQEYLPVQEESGNALARVVGSTPGQDNRITFIVYVSAIMFAENFIHLTNAYFIPDDWSLLSNDEVNAVILSRDFALTMEEMFAMDLAESDEIRRDEWEERPLLQKITEAFAHLFVQWL